MRTGPGPANGSPVRPNDGSPTGTTWWGFLGRADTAALVAQRSGRNYPWTRGMSPAKSAYRQQGVRGLKSPVVVRLWCACAGHQTPLPLVVRGIAAGGQWNSRVRVPRADDLGAFPFLVALDDPAAIGANGPKVDPLKVLTSLIGPPEPWVSPQEGDLWFAAGLVITHRAELRDVL